MKGILNALAFFSLFDHPLNKDEIFKYAYRGDVEGAAPEDVLNEMVSKGLIKYSMGLYSLKTSADFVETRKTHEIIAADFFKKVRKWSFLFRMVPFIKMAAVCNNLAFGCPKAGSDIDIFIIAGKKRIFTARVFVTLLCHLFGVRRYGHKIAGRFCLSFFISEDGLDLSSTRKSDDVYFDFWMATLKPFYGSGEYAKFMKSNRWIKEIFPNLDTGENEGMINDKTLRIKKIMEKMWGGQLGDFLEKTLKSMNLQRHESNLKIMDKRASVVVSDTMLKYHNVDRRDEFRQRYQEVLIKNNI